jgi:hypothetical protein
VNDFPSQLDVIVDAWSSLAGWALFLTLAAWHWRERLLAFGLWLLDAEEPVPMYVAPAARPEPRHVTTLHPVGDNVVALPGCDFDDIDGGDVVPFGPYDVYPLNTPPPGANLVRFQERTR